MSELKDKYVLDTTYTWGFYQGQSPTHIDYAARLNGVVARPRESSFNYCELGCGNGLTTNVLAAALPEGNYYAVDLNPIHVENGRRTAARGGLSNVTFLHSSFEDLPARELPQFDYITLQGVYSWVSAEVRRDVVKFIGKFLKPGGLVYNGYNTLPGWASQMPLRQLLLNYTNGMKGNSLARAAEGLKYLQRLRDNGAAYFKQNPDAGAALDRLLKSDLRYVVHEFFNESWQPQYFSEVATEMAEAGLDYCGTTAFSRNYFDLGMPQKFRDMLNGAANKFVRETHKSLILNERFRADVYFKGTEPAPPAAQEKLFDDTVIGAVERRENIKRMVQLADFSISYTGKIYDDLLTVLADGTRTVAEIVSMPAFGAYEKSVVTKSINNFVAGGQFQPLATKMRESDTAGGGNFRLTLDFNRSLLEDRLLEDGRAALASQVLGNGVFIPLVPGLLLRALDASGPERAVDHACELMQESGKSLHKDGQELSGTAGLRSALAAEWESFCQRQIPELQRFGIIERR